MSINYLFDTVLEKKQELLCIHSKQLYIELFAIKFDNPVKFMEQISGDQEHIFWGAARDFSREILQKSISWYWLSEHVDDYAGLMEDNLRKKIPLWLLKAKFGRGSLAKHLDDTKTVVRWIMDRYVNELKNLFDKRYRNYISPILFVSYEEKNYEI